MLYASDLFRMQGTDLVGREEMPDDLPDLVAEILVHTVEERQRRNLNRSYAFRQAVLDRVRGRIEVFPTERNQLLQRGKIVCRFEELTIDTPRNRYVRGALDAIARRVKDQKVKHRCRKLARNLRALGVTGVVPTRTQMSADRLGRHDANDRFMIAAAKLAFDLALLTESPGSDRLPVPEKNDPWLRKLFERAVGGFYAVTLWPTGWKVSTGTRLQWPVEARTPHADTILPTMQTDIILRSSLAGRTIVIDTKFTSLLVAGHYRDQHREKRLNIEHLYQMYAYLRSQEDGDSRNTSAEGLLLHPSVGEHIDEAVRIQGHLIRFATVNLAGHQTDMREDLLRAVEAPPPI